MWKITEEKIVTAQTNACVYTCQNRRGTKIEVTNIGCSIISLQIKGRDVVLDMSLLSSILITPFTLVR